SRAISVTGQWDDLGPRLSEGIEVRDQDGRVWPVLASDYDETHARVSYLFDRPLPAGHYVVRLPQGGLTDLAGISPVAEGQPRGTLAQFDVPPRRAPRDPFDYGALLPERASSGVRFEGTAGPGQLLVYRLVVTVPGMYTLVEGPMSGRSSIQLV